MAKIAHFYGEVKEGQLKLDNSEVFKSWIKTLEGLRVELKIEKEKKDITQSQWAYLFACVYAPISQETGYSVEEVDGMLKKRHLTRNKDMKNEYVKDKSRMTRGEIAEYLDRCIQDAANLGIVVLPANRFWRMGK